jgi:hypothetical protein
MTENGVLITDFDRFGLEDGVAFVSALLAAGFRWGGTWSQSIALARAYLAANGHTVRDGRVDAMHFELELSPREVEARDWDAHLRTVLSAAEREEDPLGALTEQQQTDLKKDTNNLAVLFANFAAVTVGRDAEHPWSDAGKELGRLANTMRGIRLRMHGGERPGESGAVQDGWDFADAVAEAGRA